MIDKRFLTSGISIGLLRIFHAVIGFATAVILTRLLGVERFGQYAYAIVLLTMSTIPVSYGWGLLLLRTASASQFNGDWRETKGVIIRGAQYAFLITAALATIGGAISFLPALHIPALPTGWALLPLGFVLLFDQLSALRNALLRAIDRPVFSQIPEMVLRPLTLIAGVGVGAFLLGENFGLEAALGALLVAALATLLLGTLMLRAWAPSELKAASTIYDDRSWLMSALPMGANSGLFLFSAYLDILILGIMSTPSDVGIYRIAAQIGVLSGLAYTSLNMIAAQRFAYHRSAENDPALQKTATGFARVAFACNFAATITLVATAHWLVPLVFGAEFKAAIIPLLIISAGQTVNAACGMPNTLLTMSGHERQVTLVMTLATAANAGLCVLTIPDFGPLGAAVATFAAISFANIALWLIARRRLAVDTSILGTLRLDALTSAFARPRKAERNA